MFYRINLYLKMIKQAILLIILALAFRPLNAVLQVPKVALGIIYVSQLPDAVISPALVSMRGGALIYIKVIGHSLMVEKLSIKVGQFPCKIPADGVTDTFITCETTDSRSLVEMTGLKVTLKSDGLQVTSSAPNTVSYVDSRTSQLSYMFPTSNFGGQIQNYFGIHRLESLGDGRNMGDIRALNIGSDLCSRFDIVQPAISNRTENYIKCQTSVDQEAGKYMISQQFTSGFANKDKYLSRSSLQVETPFDYTFLPTVNSVTPNTGNQGGQLLTLKGTGFSPRAQNNTVSVDGNNCKVTSVEGGMLKCTLEKRNHGISSKLTTTTTTTQQNGYFSGKGLAYARYNYQVTAMGTFVQAVRNNTAGIPAGTKVQSGYRTQINEGNTYGQRYGQVWKGYFTAPTTGQYTFRGLGDDQFSLFLSTVQGSTEFEAGATSFISSTVHSWDWKNFYFHDYTGAENSRTLTAGKSYYLEAYHLNYGGSGFFRVEVDVPNTNINLPNQKFEVHFLDIDSTVQPQIVHFNMTTTAPGQAGQFNLKIYRTDSNNIPIYNVNRTVDYGCTADDFKAALNSFDIYSSSGISVTRVLYDDADNVVSNVATSTKANYTVSIYKLRTTQQQAQNFIIAKISGFGGSLSQPSTFTEHSPLISGNFSMIIGGSALPGIFPYNVAAWTLQSKIRELDGYSNVQVAKYTADGQGYKTRWIISYKGMTAAVDPVVVSAAALSGGASGTVPTIALTIRRTYSPHITFNPVDYRFLNTVSSGPNIIVTTNGLQSVCTGNCIYSFNDKFNISSFSIASNVLTLALDDADSVLDVDKLYVTVQGQICTKNAGTQTIASYQCTIASLAGNVPKLTAGPVIPAVYMSQLGFAGVNTGVIAHDVPLVASLHTTTGGQNGGYFNNLTGTGFPQDAKDISITICLKKVTIVENTRTTIGFFMPSCDTPGDYSVIIDVGSVRNSLLNFTYSATASVPTITSLNTSSSNPAFKTILQISGNGFGIDSAAVKVFLSNATGQIYQLRILQCTDILIKVGLSGGLTGDYRVQVTLPATLGTAIANPIDANKFSYNSIITSISPITGSYFGGTLLTITGTNFLAQKMQNLVSVGMVLNWMCRIQTVSATQITCRTPQIHPYYTASTPQKVVVASRLVVDSLCPGNNCQFTYMANTSSPILKTTSSAEFGAVSLTLTGTDLSDPASGGCKVVLRNLLTDVLYEHSTTSCTSTIINFTVLNTVPTGKYEMRVRNLIGQSNALAVSVTWAIGTASLMTGGSTQGGIVTFTNGANYPTSLDAPFSITIVTNISNTLSLSTIAKIVSCCAGNELKFAFPPAPAGSLLTFLINGPLGQNKRTLLISSSATPAISITSTNPIDSGTIPVPITVSSANFLQSTVIVSINLVSKVNPGEIINIPAWNTIGTDTTFNATLNAGAYMIKLLTSVGYAISATPINVNKPASVTSAPLISSFAGGLFTVTGNNLSPSSYITVNGLRGDIKTYSSSSVVYNAPALVTVASQSAFKLRKIDLIDQQLFTVVSDTASTNSSAAFDQLVTTFYGSNNTACFIQVNLNTNLQAVVDRVRLFPNLNWANTAVKLLGATFEGSNNNATWTVIGTVDQTIHSGWNFIKSKTSEPFKHIRFSHTSDSQCNIAEIQLYGIVLSSINVTLASQVVNVVYNDGFNTQIFQNAIQYKQDNTPIVQSVVPPYGDTFGTYDITIKGQNLDFGTSDVLIDGVPCVKVISSSTSTQLVCTVGARPTIPATNSFSVYINNAKAILKGGFLYVLKWSDSRTWGVDLPPIKDDLVYVPPGMTLLVDVNTPILAGIVVQKGTLIFPNDTDITVRTGFITLNGGAFIAGTEDNPLHSNLQFIMYGNYYGKQQPMFGNKGIGCSNCKFSMYGKPRIPTWTTISATIQIGSTTFIVSEDVDWQVGETIVVASTSFNHEQAEKRIITGKSSRTITVDKPFGFKHVSVQQTYGTSDKLQMRAEVGLLTRNIKMKGDDETSVIGKYGSHLMIAGKGSDGAEGQIGYTEFTQCGQPQIVGRYCTHFHMAGQVPTSFVRGIAVHQSFARVVTLHGVYQLTVEKNVGYRVRGHNFFVEDGIETHNTIRYNLAISSIAVSNMMQTDTSVASFWITNPTNDVYGNHAAGSDFYGFWYEIKKNPDGPSATNDICPRGNPLGLVANNVAHSNKRFGLRIFHLYARKYPCNPINNFGNQLDPWGDNPSINSTFYNFTIYKNQEDGVLAQDVGNVHFHNFTVAQSVRAGFQYHITNYTKQIPTIYNCAIIGKTQQNIDTNESRYDGSSGVITTRSGQLNIFSVRFYNFPLKTTVLKTCSHCDDLLLFTTRGVQIFLRDLTFESVSGNYLFMIGVKKDVIYDLDGSLANAFGAGISSGNPVTIVQNYNHIKLHNACYQPSSSAASKWDGTIMCDSTVTIRRAFFTNILEFKLFTLQDMKVIQLDSIDQVVPTHVMPALFTTTNNKMSGKQPMEQSKHTWALPFALGKTYQVWWGNGIDFKHLSVGTSRLLAGDLLPAIIFKFNYTQNREIFEIGPFKGGKLLRSTEYINKTQSHLSHSNCRNGQHYHNNNDGAPKMLTLCQSGRDKSLSELTDVNGIFCRFMCPQPPGTFVKEAFIRKWSNATQWPNEIVPGIPASNGLGTTNLNALVHGNWTVIIDVPLIHVAFLTIDGDLIADDKQDVNITAKSIHIRAGNLTAGSPALPFVHKLTIQITNNRQSEQYSIDEMVGGNKFIVVTGSLNLFSQHPSTVQTTLKASAFPGNTSILVQESNDWIIGDTIGISPSYSIHTQYEKVTITGITDNGQNITFTPALLYKHYGANSQFSTDYGKIDLRAKVAHLNRNITIATGPDYGWGTSVLVYGYKEPMSNITRVGSVNLVGVEIQNGGQYDTSNSPVKFLNTVNGNYTSLIQGTSFVNCQAWCMNIQNANNLTINNNVFYNIFGIGIQAVKVKSFKFTKNLIIGVVKRPTAPGKQLSTCFGTYEYINPATDDVKITDNFCLGAYLHGFALPHIACGEIQTTPYKDNTVGSANMAFIFTKASDFKCQAFSYAKAYASGMGNIMGTPGIETLILSNFTMVDNGRGVTVKFGNGQGHNNHTGFFRNSYVGAISRPTCAQCYGPGAISCNSITAMQMLTVSGNGETLPKKFGGGYDTICRAQSFQNKVYMENVVFDNYRQNYSGAALSSCGANFVFVQHHLSEDSVADHNLRNVKCQSCDAHSFIYAMEQNPKDLGWFGGCGDILCTGRSNFVITDFTGQFLGAPGTIIPHNRAVGDNQAGCVRSSIMNAHICSNRLDFATLAFQSIAADSNLRIMWPLNMTYDGSTYTNIVNGWREWQWIGKEPQNKRKGRFLSIVTLNKTYNISFLAMPPVKMEFLIQKRTLLGDNNNYVIVKIVYPLPNMIQISAGGVVKRPILIQDSGIQRPLNVAQCGDNTYFFKNYTTHFVITEGHACNVRLELLETVQLTTRFSVDVSAFMSDSVRSSYLSNLCALLNINDFSRVKIVGIRSGSAIIDVNIVNSVENNTALNNSGSTTPEPTLAQITAQLGASVQTGTLAQALLGSIPTLSNATLLSTNIALHLLPTDETTQDTSTKTNIGLIVGAAIAGVVILCLGVLGFCHILRRRAKVGEEVINSEANMEHEDKSANQDDNELVFEESGEPQMMSNNKQNSEIKINQNDSNLIKIKANS